MRAEKIKVSRSECLEGVQNSKDMFEGFTVDEAINISLRYPQGGFCRGNFSRFL